MGRPGGVSVGHEKAPDGRGGGSANRAESAGLVANSVVDTLPAWALKGKTLPRNGSLAPSHHVRRNGEIRFLDDLVGDAVDGDGGECAGHQIVWVVGGLPPDAVILAHPSRLCGAAVLGSQKEMPRVDRGGAYVLEMIDWHTLQF